ncbi:hypothetical protein AYK21_04545 [Thermoplasmatales archaeon SG8-52-2]|nr:MAG: hypothetical protein AYK21_04545 [Thermoplasmatales archaeon SG8-52-2]
MMKKQKTFCLTIICILLFSMNVSAIQIEKNKEQINLENNHNPIENCLVISSGDDEEDIDPLVDLEVTVTIKEIRALDKIDFIGKPDFYVKVFINDEVNKSKTWRNQKYVNESWSTTVDVNDTEQNVSIKIQLWDKFLFIDKLCDLSENNEYFRHKHDIELTYNLKTGKWRGDDFIYPFYAWSDHSGYGRLNGCDDNSIYQRDRDCLILFDITQNDYDGDGIPYWTEVNVYDTDPMVDDTGSDNDNDGVPIEWEHKWGNLFYRNWHTGKIDFYFYYHPNVTEDHDHLDPDNDGLDNIEEYLTSEWGSDPFRQDIFVELDQMESGPDGEPASVLTDEAKDLLRDAFDKQNIVLHIDDGCMGGGEWIPFEQLLDPEEGDLERIYRDYFLHGNESNWRKGVFHYGLVVYDATFQGFVFHAADDYSGAFQISSKYVDKKDFIPTARRRHVSYASVYMHELGHTLEINIPGGHDEKSKAIWQPHWWKFRPYKSCMNYGYTYFLVDYSDGSRGRNDHDDWSNLDLVAFQRNVAN